MLKLATKLKERADALGITNVEAARRCDLDRRRYGHYVTGRSRPNYETLLKICKALGTSPNLLLDFRDGNQPEEIDQLISVALNLSSDQIKFLIATADTLKRTA